MNKQLKFLLFFIFLTLNVLGQKNSKVTREEQIARMILKYALTDTTQYDYLNSKSIVLLDKEHAIKFAEQILTDTYGKKRMEIEKPYKAFYIDKFWVICGSLPRQYVGGTFNIVIDSYNGKVISLTHSK